MEKAMWWFFCIAANVYQLCVVSIKSYRLIWYNYLSQLALVGKHAVACIVEVEIGEKRNMLTYRCDITIPMVKTTLNWLNGQTNISVNDIR